MQYIDKEDERIADWSVGGVNAAAVQMGSGSRLPNLPIFTVQTGCNPAVELSYVYASTHKRIRVETDRSTAAGPAEERRGTTPTVGVAGKEKGKQRAAGAILISQEHTERSQLVPTG